MLKEYIETHDTITRDYITSLTYNSVTGILNKYTKGTGVQFKDIGKDTYVIIK
jgi:hypothetical protein